MVIFSDRYIALAATFEFGYLVVLVLTKLSSMRYFDKLKMSSSDFETLQYLSKNLFEEVIWMLKSKV